MADDVQLERACAGIDARGVSSDGCIVCVHHGVLCVLWLDCGEAAFILDDLFFAVWLFAASVVLHCS